MPGCRYAALHTTYTSHADKGAAPAQGRLPHLGHGGGLRGRHRETAVGPFRRTQVLGHKGRASGAATAAAEAAFATATTRARTGGAETPCRI